MTEWAKTIAPNGDCRMRHYAFDKLACGLVDMHLYAGHPDAVPLLEKVTAYARGSLAREPKTVTPSHNTQYYGLPQEWYTLSENQYRAYQATGNSMFKDFGISGSTLSIGTSSRTHRRPSAHRAFMPTAT